MIRNSVKLLTGEIIPTEYGECSDPISGEPMQTIPITYDKYLKLNKPRNCGTCGRELDQWEINVNIVNYYNEHVQNKKGRPKFICYGCACRQM